MAEYVGYPNIRGWTGQPAEIARAAEGFRATYERVPVEDGDYTMNHTASVFLFDAEGRFVTRSITTSRANSRCRRSVAQWGLRGRERERTRPDKDKPSGWCNCRRHPRQVRAGCDAADSCRVTTGKHMGTDRFAAVSGGDGCVTRSSNGVCSPSRPVLPPDLKIVSAPSTHYRQSRRRSSPGRARSLRAKPWTRCWPTPGCRRNAGRGGAGDRSGIRSAAVAAGS